MNVAVREFGLAMKPVWMTTSAVSFRPPSWPPPRDWPVSVDRDGTVLSLWGDPIWDLSPLAGTSFKLNFGDGELAGQADPLDAANADLLRRLVTWRMWGRRAVRKTSSLMAEFTRMRAVIALCSRNGIPADRLMRFPLVVDQIPGVMTSSRGGSLLAEFHRLYDARDEVGFVVLDAEGLKRLAAARVDHVEVQTPYIPPRIWTYQLSRLRACIDDFLAQKEKIEACFMFTLEAYTSNYGSLQQALDPSRDRGKAPFIGAPGRRMWCTFHGPFNATAERFGILELLKRWLGGDSNRLFASSLSTYFSLVTAVGAAYIANFTLQRKEEVASLRTSCLVWEEDEKLGRVPLICGETTKTDPDSDARWVGSPSVGVAVEALSIIARLRMRFDSVNPVRATTEADVLDPYLFSSSTEPWGGGKGLSYDIRIEACSIKEYLDRYPMLLDPEQLRITSEDLKIARRLTPNLPETQFAVGKVWPLAWHQYRRTGAVNMFASGLISDASMQQQMKHSSRLMPLYYGRGYTRLRLNDHAEAAVITAMYEALAAQLQSAMSDRFVSPQSAERKDAMLVNLLSEKETKTLVAWARSGKVTFREHRLGGCMKAGACEYGGVESIARCAGGDGGKPCGDVLFDRGKATQIRERLAASKIELSRLVKGSPRFKALESECRGMEKYLNVVEDY